MSELKLKFISDQSHQKRAVDSIIQLFNGFSKIETTFKLDDEIVSNMSVDSQFNEELIIENLNQIREINKLVNASPQTTQLEVNEGLIVDGVGNDSWRFPEFTVEMETGTGKTYVYLRTIYELSIKYGFLKYIIVVPSIAIYEGVKKAFDITKSHFQAIYGNHTVNLNQYDGQRMGIIRNFATSTTTEIILITLDSFNKASNTIYRASEKLPGELKPYEFIQKTRPVVIMDEPQNMESPIAKAAIRTLYPLFSLRYSATHRTNPNQLYRLSPVEAFRQNLVKKIQVVGVTEDKCANLPYIEIVKVDRQLKARIRTNAMDKGMLREEEFVLKQNDDLYKKTGNDLHKGYIVKEISLKNGGYIKFENEEKVDVRNSIGPSRKDIFRVQIRETIEQHMKMQQKFHEKGIKVLSLFFIDRVANYMDDDGVIKKLFDEEFNNIKQRYKIFKKYKPEDIRRAYFAVMRKKKKSGEEEIEYVDEEAKNQAQRDAEKDAFELIMKDKERLLSFEEPVCFIFAHSALKEGWDNPNVFQICTLNQTVSTMRKRQEIGRGLRLCVNQNGERIQDEEINVLTVIANESYESYARNLQNDYVEDGEMEAPPKPTDATRKSAKINKNIIESKDFLSFWGKLNRSTEYSININTDELIKECIEKLNNTIFPLPKIVVEKSNFIITEFIISLKSIKKGKAFIEVNKKNTENAEEDYSSTHGCEEKDDLSKIHKDDRLRGFVIAEIVEKGEQSEVLFGNGEKIDLYNPYKFETEAGQVPKSKTVSRTVEFYPVFNIVERAAKETGLTRRTINRIFKEMNEDKKKNIFTNPEGFSGIFIATIKEYLSNHMANTINYSIIKDAPAPYLIDEIFPESITYPQREMILGNQSSLYDQMQIDSDVEKNFVEDQLKHDNNVIFFFKFNPKFKVQVPSIIGNYNPDWGIVRIADDGKKKLELVRETKGNIDPKKLRSSNEGRKLLCGSKHFRALGVDYRFITDKTARWWDAEDLSNQQTILTPESKKIVNITDYYIKNFKGREFKDALPVFTLKAACGKFGDSQEIEPDGWVSIERKGLKEGWFIAQAIGKSMEPTIPDGSYCIFRPVPAGSKDGRILLIQHRDVTDPENGGKYTLKRYTKEIKFDASGKETKIIILKPENDKINPIILHCQDEDYENQFQVIGEFVGLYE